jgi:hypothetical protein
MQQIGRLYSVLVLRLAEDAVTNSFGAIISDKQSVRVLLARPLGVNDFVFNIGKEASIGRESK